MSTPATIADKWMNAGIDEDVLARKTGQATKEHRLNAGWFFYKARQEIKHGDWGEFVLRYKHKIPDRTIRRYCEFTADALRQAKEANPEVRDAEKLLAIAKKMPLESPIGYVALARSLGEFPLQGQYDADRYAINKHKGDEQQEFTFSYETVIEQLKVVEAAPNFYKLSVKALDDLAARCESTAKLCRKVRADRETKQTKTLELIEA